MSNWHHPDWHYSSKFRFSFPTPPPAEAAAAANTASAAMPPPHHPYPGHGHGFGHGRGYHYRPRFGVFRRMIWVSYPIHARPRLMTQFGLGVGAANWYLHSRDRKDHFRQCLPDQGSASHTADGLRASDAFQEKHNHDWRGQWRFPHQPDMTKSAPVTSFTPAKTELESQVLASLPIPEVVNPQEESPKWGWGARREERRKRREERAAIKSDSSEKEEVQKLKEAVDKIWAERKQAAIDIQATANAKVRLAPIQSDLADI